VNIRNIGCEGYFYDDSKDINQLVEKTLGKLESKFNVACNKLIANENLDCLKRDEEIAAAYFVATQLLRTKEHREVIRDMIRQLTKRLAKNKLSKEFEKELSEVGTKESIKSSHIRMLKRCKTRPSFDPSLDKFIDDEEAIRGEELAEWALALSRVLPQKSFKVLAGNSSTQELL